MFDHCADPAYLQRCLESFLGHWHGDREPWFGIDPQKLAQTQLPQPLMWLYGYAGGWHGHNYWNHLLGNQDCLVPFESLTIENGKLVFVWENQGVWKLGTETEGADPAVWIITENQAWQLLDTSLSQFLVTFIFHETLFGLRHLGSGTDLCAKLTAAGMQVVPLWLNKPYPNGLLSFHIANGRYLIMDDSWCATDESEPWKLLPEVFKDATGKSPGAGFDRYDAIPEHIQVPAMMRSMHLGMVIERHQQQIDYHEGRCRLYREMLKRFESEPINTPARS